MNTVLITGGCGFIGSNFILFLFNEPSFTGSVINLDVCTYAANPSNLADLAEEYGDRYRFRKIDLNDGPAVLELFETDPIDTVVHFAAESHVDRSISGPKLFVETNVMGTLHLLEAARANAEHLVRFHHVSTDEVYGELGESGAFREDTPYHPNSPYSASKAASDHLVRAYAHTYGLPITISNCSNNYGPYQFPEKLIPLMMLNAMEGKSLPVYGDGSNIRDWLHVVDHCEAIWAILQRGSCGETYNVGGGTELPNLDVVRTICALADDAHPDRSPHSDLIEFVKDRPGHDWRYAIDATKIERELGWSPRHDFETGLRETFEWYRNQPQWVESVRSGAYQEWVETHYADES